MKIYCQCIIVLQKKQGKTSNALKEPQETSTGQPDNGDPSNVKCDIISGCSWVILDPLGLKPALASQTTETLLCLAHPHILYWWWIEPSFWCWPWWVETCMIWVQILRSPFKFVQHELWQWENLLFSWVFQRTVVIIKCGFIMLMQLLYETI